MSIADDSFVAVAADDDRRKWLALYVLCVGMLMIVLDATIVNVALPSIQDDLGFSQSNLAWVVNAYLIAFGGLLLLAGRIGDLIGQRRIFLIGLAVFTAASLLCALAQTQGMLIAARFIQGAGGAIGSAVILGMIVVMFPEPREQAKAIGVFSFVASAGASIGLLAGGVLTEAISWHWIFFVNVPIGIAIAILARRLVEDAPGIVLDAVSIALLVSFLLRQARIETPLMPLRLFRSRNVTGANLVMGLLVVGFFGMFFLGALYLQGILGYSPLGVGLAFLPASIVMGTLSLGYAEKLIMGIGPKAALVAGLVSAGAGLVLFAQAPVDGNYVTDVLAVMLLLGAGAGLAFPALMTLAMSGATPSDAGLASGLVNTTVQVGGAIGLAVLTTLASERTGERLADGESLNSALNAGYHLAYLIGAAAIVAAIVVAAIVLRSKRAEAAEEQRPSMEP